MTIRCDQKLTNEFLCEERPRVQSDTSDIMLSNISSSPKRNYVTCPAGHVTHSFLACDSTNACFLDDDTETARCLAPLSPLPPSFHCSNVKMRVPYTVICDFRYDCWDRSDEDFCSFLPCKGTGVFDCGNGQVRHIFIFRWYSRRSDTIHLRKL